MKKLFYILAVASLAFVSCNKEIIENNPDNKPVVKGETITFTASIDVPASTKAALSGQSISWEDGDYVGICTDNDATIVAYPVTVDGSDATQATITVNAVSGANAYYAIFKGRLNGDTDEQKVAADDFSKITFDASTKTFSGLTVGASQVGVGSIYSYLWHDSGYPLSMAGKSDGNSLLMKPCLALIKLQLDAESVPTDKAVVEETYNNPTYNVDHVHKYSAVRGFDFYQRASSSLMSSGDFSVSISDSNELTVTASGNNSAVREKAGSDRLQANTPYYMCVIPGGDVSSFRINFIGYDTDSGAASWSTAYQMNLTKAMTVKPGDFYDLGTLNPLGRKKAKTHSEDDAADAAAAAAASAAVTIDGVFTDWSSVTNTFTTSDERIVEWKYTSDNTNIYFLYKVVKAKISFSSSYNWGAYIALGLNYDNLASTGANAGQGIDGGYEAKALIYPWRGTTEGSPEGFVGTDGNGNLEYPVGTSLGHIVNVGSAIDGDYSYVEVSIPRAQIGNPSGTITVNHSINWNVLGEQQINIGGPQMSYILASDQTVGVGQTVDIAATTNSTASLSYVSNDTSIATVDGNGVITGVAVGSTTVTISAAAVGENYTAATKTINVTVTAAFTPAIVIDGDFDDWDEIAEYDGTIRGNGSANTRVSVWKVTSDARYVYVYMKLVTEKLVSYPDRYIGIGFDTDQNDETGSSQYNIAGCEKSVRIYPAKASTNPVEFVTGADPRSRTDSSTVGTHETWGVYDTGDSSTSTYSFVEVSISRESIGLTSASTIKIATSYDNYDTVKQTLVLN